ncbi:MAG TPA: hypothetical protein VE959_34535 [Bryobacteraceae bacterium]|nr:hypothetical protein [Bryobacteraceae bacterium]
MPVEIEQMEPVAAAEPRPPERPEEQAADLQSEVGEFITRHVLENDATFFDG